MKVHLVPLSIVILTALVGCGGGGSSRSQSAAACAELAGRTIAAATVVAAVDVAASGQVPAYCKVSARIQPALNFEMRIPNGWNGKLHYGGGGGFNGFIPQVFDAAGGRGNPPGKHSL